MRNMLFLAIKRQFLLFPKYGARYSSSKISTTTVICEVFKCSYENALNIATSYPDILSAVSTETLRKRVKFLTQELRIDSSNILENPRIIRINSTILSQRLQTLKDYGFTNNIFSLVFEYNSLMKKSPEELKDSGIISTDPVKHVQSLLDEEMNAKITRHLSAEQYMNKPLLAVHKDLLALLVTTWLGCPEELALLILQKHLKICTRSITSFNKMLSILFQDLKISKSKVTLRNSKILTVPPHHLFKLVEGSGPRNAALIERIRAAPSILHTNPDQFNELEKILNKHGITKEQRQNINALTASPKHLEKCFAEIEKHQEFKCLKELPNYLCFVCSIFRLVERMTQMKASGYVSWSLHTLNLSPEQFRHRLTVNDDTCLGSETIQILAKTLNKTKQEVKKQLRLHPKFMRVSYYNAHLVVKGLLSRGVTTEQIWNALPIVLYDHDLVMKRLAEMATYSELTPFDEWRCHPKLVSLIVYYLEKDNFFSFLGVFQSTDEKISQEL